MQIEYKQNDLKRGIPLAIIYFITVFLICYFIFGGISGMADAVNNFGSARGIGLLVGLGFLAPFFVLSYMAMPKMKIELHPDKMVIFKNKLEPVIIPYNNISQLQFNVRNINRLDILDRNNNIVFYLQPQHKVEVLQQTISAIAQHKGFIKQTGQKRYFGRNIQTIIYISKG